MCSCIQSQALPACPSAVVPLPFADRPHSGCMHSVLQLHAHRPRHCGASSTGALLHAAVPNVEMSCEAFSTARAPTFSGFSRLSFAQNAHACAQFGALAAQRGWLVSRQGLHMCRDGVSYSHGCYPLCAAAASHLQGFTSRKQVWLQTFAWSEAGRQRKLKARETVATHIPDLRDAPVSLFP